ncbi:MAG: hypothetical protein KDA69_22095, partial [Planctomycetaceae bacterium]|nr:hypothetical protein [Planctomycetaceae bacterium]
MFFSKKKNDEQPAETLVPEEDAIAVADITLDADEAIETEAGEIEITQPSDAVKAQNAVEAAGRGAVSKRRQAMDPKRLEELFSRVNSLLGGAEGAEGPFRPVLPESLEDTGLTDEEVEKL